MTTLTARNRLLELWPELSAEQQTALVAEAERLATPRSTRALSPRERTLIERSKADFAAGRVFEEKDYDTAMDTFMTRLTKQGQP